ncbi:MAG: hypothetical protein R3316_08505 [Rhodovibrionaceae bacterium]|nr:hypothetical protein [Rhodovibrionaceae bacterium]
MSADHSLKRTERLQIMLDDDELKAIDDWRFEHRMPSRAAAIRELLRRGMVAHNVPDPHAAKSSEFSVVEPGKES